MSWEYLPPAPLGHLSKPNIAPERASQIFMAYIDGCTKGEIARIFGERLEVVRAVIEVARQAALMEREMNQ